MSTKDLTNQEAIAKIKELSEKARICMFCTELDRLPVNSRPMGIQETDGSSAAKPATRISKSKKTNAFSFIL